MAGILFKRQPQPVNDILGGIRCQTSLFGQPIPIVYGRSRIAGNLLWYSNFTSQPIQGKGGKGGLFGGKAGNQTYDYGAAVIIGLCQGQIQGVASVWDTQGTLPSNDASEDYTVPSGGGSYTVLQQATFISDLGVTEAEQYSQTANDYGSPGPVTITGTNNVPLTSGQYSQSNGKYTFGSALAGAQLTINYTYGPPNTEGSDPISTLNLSFFDGGQGQSPWSWLETNYPAEAIGYTYLAYAATPQMDLGTSGALPNLTFEIIGLNSVQPVPGSYDCNPRDIIYDLLTNEIYGCSVPTSLIADLSQYSDYCLANGVLFSPAMTEQQTAAEYIDAWLKASNSEMVRVGFQLGILPYGDTTAVGNGATFSPETNPVYDLDDDDYIYEEGTPPVRCKRASVRDAYNSVTVQFNDRSNNYNPNPIEADNQWAQDQFGYRPESPRDYDFICTGQVATTVATTLLSRMTFIRNVYTFTLRADYILLDPMDIVTITDEYMGLDQAPVRITRISETKDKQLEVEAEEFPWGCSGPTLYPKQGAGQGGIIYANIGIGAFVIDAPGSSYLVGDIGNVAGGTGGQVNVTAVNGSGAVETAVLISPGYGFSISSNVSVSGGHGSGFTVNVTAAGSGGGGHIEGSVAIGQQFAVDGGQGGVIQVTGIQETGPPLARYYTASSIEVLFAGANYQDGINVSTSAITGTNTIGPVLNITQTSGGGYPQANADPSFTNPPIAFEAISRLRGADPNQELWLALSGNSVPVTFTGGGGSGAVAYGVLNNGAVQEVVIVDAGTGYTSAPTAVFGGESGYGASATVNVNVSAGTVTAVTVTAGGQQYESAWGGCQVYLSTDNVTFVPVGQQNGSAVMGETTADWPAASDPDSTNNLSVDLSESNGVLESVSTTIENNFGTLFYVSGGYANIPYELGAYAVATLTGPNQYTLQATGAGNYLRRNVFGAPNGASGGVDHPMGSAFCLLNQQIFKIVLDPNIAGQTLYLKFPSFNTRGAMPQSLASVPTYTMTPYGLLQGLYGFGYSISPSSCLTQDATTHTQIDLSAFQVVGTPGAISYKGTTFPGCNSSAEYSVYVYDPAFVGDLVNTLPTAPSVPANNIPGVLTAYQAWLTSDTTDQPANTAGWIFLGSIQLASGGGGTGGGGGQQGGNTPKKPPQA